MVGRRTILVSVCILSLLVAGCTGSAVPVPSDGVGDVDASSSSSAWATPPAPEAAVEPNGSEAAPNGTLEVHFINVGQGDSVLIRTPANETVLIDSGDWRDDGEHVLGYLRARNVTRIDHLVTSHADADHIGGHERVIEHYETEAGGVGAVYDPGLAANSRTYEAYLDAIERHDVTLYRTGAGDRLPIEGANASVLAPPSESLADGERNENSLVLTLEHGDHRFLFPGDGEAAAEEYLTSTYDERLDVVAQMAGHHGSRTSTSAALLAETSPAVVVISSAYDSQYGHPHEETLRRLAERNVSTYWTGVHGTVVLASAGDRLTVATQRNATADPLELRSADPAPPGAAADVEVRTVVDEGDRDESASETDATGTADATSESTPTATVTPTATAAPTATATPAPTATETEREATAGALELAETNADASGNDHENENGEYLVFRNAREGSLDLSGWTVSDAAGHTYAFPSGFTLEAGATVTLYTGSGTDADDELYWGSGSAVWNNGGDTVTVTDDEGSVVLEVTYP